MIQLNNKSTDKFCRRSTAAGLFGCVLVFVISMFHPASLYGADKNSSSKKGGIFQISKSGPDEPDMKKLPTFINSDSLTVKMKERVFQYAGNVEVTHGDTKITCALLDGNYDEHNQVKELFARTNVVIHKGENITGTSNLAHYEADKDVVTLTENPQLEQNDSTLSADKIKVFLKDNRSVAEGQVRVKMAKGANSPAKVKTETPTEPDPNEVTDTDDTKKNTQKFVIR